LALYQGTASAVPERNAKIGGFSRWYPASGAKALLMKGLLAVRLKPAEAVP